MVELQMPDERVVEMWRALALAPTGFAEPSVVLVATDDARLGPAGWCSVVVLGQSAVVVTPTAQPPQFEELLARSPEPIELTDHRHVEEVAGPLAATLGPADLQYGAVHQPPGSGVQGPLTFADPLVKRLLADTPPDDRSEAGFEDTGTEAIFVALVDDRPVAAAGLRRWPGGIAHLGVLTSPPARRQGMGRQVAAAAAGYATEQGLVVQWRSRWDNHASRRLGHRLGLRRCGRQFSFRLLPD